MKTITHYDLVEKTKELIYSKDELAAVLGKTTKDEKKAYTPSKKMMEKLEEVSEKVEKNISGFFVTSSPFKHLHVDTHMTQMIKWHFPFSKKQVEEMDDMTKKETIEKGMVGIQKTIRKHRDLILDKHQMFEDTFEQEKLAFIVKNGYEPDLFTEEDYEYIEKGYIQVLKEAANHYFGLKVNPKYEGLSLEYSDYLTTKFWLYCLKWFDKMKVLDLLQWRLLLAIEEGTLSELTTDKFSVFTVCPIQSSWFNEDMHDSKQSVGYILSYQLYRYVAAFKNIDKLKELMTGENFLKMVSGILELIKFVKKNTKEQSLKEVFSLDKVNAPRIMRQYEELVRCMPNVMETLKK